MSEPIREQISALLDGELADTEMGLLVRRLERDAELRAAFGRYALISEAVRAPGDRLASVQFAARVNATIDDAAPLAVPVERISDSRPTWLRPAAFGAVAAGVGALAVALVMVREPAPTATVALSRNSAAVPVARTPATTEPVRLGAADTLVADDDSLTPYMIAHAQYAAPVARRNVLTNVIADDPGISPENAPVVSDAALRTAR